MRMHILFDVDYYSGCQCSPPSKSVVGVFTDKKRKEIEPKIKAKEAPYKWGVYEWDNDYLILDKEPNG